MTRIPVDTSVTLQQAPASGHNRWHPDIKPRLRVRAGQEVTLECRNGMNALLTRALTPADVEAFVGEIGDPHPMTGPVYIEGAEPGDVLAVEIVAIEAGPSAATPLIPGFGFLADLFPDAYCINWTLAGGVARAAELPGVAVPADMFPGVIGVAPSRTRLAEINRREADLSARGGPVVGPYPEHAIPALAGEGLRTIPPRELGGNMDTRGIVVGSTAWFPVDVPGALFSVGDLHFAQGDGEVCGTAIEMDGAITVRFRVERAPRWSPRFPAYTTPPRRARPEFATTGLPISADGRNESMDISLATRNALVEMLGYLTTMHAFTREAAYALMGAVCDLRLSELVDVPNPLVSAVIPTDIFE
jgi:formamidase